MTPDRSGQITDSGRASCPNSVLGKTFAILSAFDGNTDEVRLIQLSQRTGIPKPSVYRLSQELVDLGLLERSAGGYRLGPGLFTLGQRVAAYSHLRFSARPVLVDLCAAVHAPVHLAVLDDGHVRYVENLGGMRSVQVMVPDGASFPASLTASGKVLLAHTAGASDPEGPVLSAELRAEFDLVRERRFATERGHITPGVKAFAVPITEPSGSCVAALAAAVPISHKADRELLNLLWAAASTISREYGRRLLHSESEDCADRRAKITRQHATA